MARNTYMYAGSASSTAALAPVAELPVGRKRWTPYDPEGLHHIDVGTIWGTTDPWEFDVWGSHTLFAGESGAGKSNLSWAALCGVADRIESGLVHVYAIDPKGGFETRMGPGFFKRIADDPDNWDKEAAALLNAVRKDMRERVLKVRGTTQKHVPTLQDPLVVVWFDEMASIVDDLDTKAEQDKIKKPLRSILRLGRAAGFTVIGAVQDPRMESIPLRGLFQRRIGLRLPSANLVDMVMGDGARDDGAVCDLIPIDQPGFAFDRIKGRMTLVKSHRVDSVTIQRTAARCAVATA